MRRRRDVTTGDNLGEAVVPVFGVDPHGAAMFAGAVNGTLGQLGSRLVMDTRGPAWHGWTQSPQDFRGALGVGGGRPSVSLHTTFDQEQGTDLGNPLYQSLAERAASGRLR